MNLSDSDNSLESNYRQIYPSTLEAMRSQNNSNCATPVNRPELDRKAIEMTQIVSNCCDRLREAPHVWFRVQVREDLSLTLGSV